MTSENVTLVLADIEMPGADGVWLLRTIRSKWAVAELIVMSGRVLPVPGELPLGAKMLCKPFTADWLLQLVNGR